MRERARGDGNVAPTRVYGGKSLRPLIDELVGGHAEVSEPPGQAWIHVEPAGAEVPTRGWKLHVSAALSTAEGVLRATVPVLLAQGVAFKVAATLEVLHELNEGVGGIGQIGKFITAYPRDDEHALRAAVALDDATRGIRAPRVRGEPALRPNSIVSYRYGDFVADDADTPTARDDVPPDPFVAAGIVAATDALVVAGRYLITGTLHRSARGAVHLAVDGKDGTSCVLKRAARDARLTEDGLDARDQLRDEAAVLQQLAPHPGFPKVLDLVPHDDDLFLVLELIEGTPLGHLVARRRARNERTTASELARWANDLGGALAALHERGLVYRDMNPSNALIDRSGGAVIVDFELARPVGAVDRSFVAGTPRYMSPAHAAGGPASVDDDVFALGAVLFYAATGTDPDEMPHEASVRAALLAAETPSELVQVIVGALIGVPKRWAIDDIRRVVSGPSPTA